MEKSKIYCMVYFALFTPSPKQLPKIYSDRKI